MPVCKAQAVDRTSRLTSMILLIFLAIFSGLVGLDDRLGAHATRHGAEPTCLTVSLTFEESIFGCEKDRNHP
jgi:hypothetical protein